MQYLSIFSYTFYLLFLAISCIMFSSKRNNSHKATQQQASGSHTNSIHDLMHKRYNYIYYNPFYPFSFLLMETISIYVRRWFDKVNGNSYFNYYIAMPDGSIIPAKYNLEYWYWTQPFYTAKDHLKEQNIDIARYKIQEIDFGYWLQRDMKNMNK